MSRFIRNIRSGMSFKLLTWAFQIAPEAEKTSIAIAIQQHIRRTAS